MVATGTVRHISADEREVLVDVFVAAFEQDPWYRWLYPGHDYPSRAREWFDLVTDRVWRRADAWLAEDGEAGQIWIRPGEALASADDLTAVVGLLGRQLGDRASEVLAGIASAGGYEPSAPHALCLYIGVRPGRRGAGIGRELMQAALDRYATRQAPSYLNSTNPRNVAFYERLGFQVVGRSEVSPGVALTSMVRDAAG